MIFKALQKSSLIEYPGKISSIVWTAECNFRCPFCYNVDLVLHPEKGESISEETILEHLKKRKQWVDALSITGGEPTLHKDLPEFLAKVKKIRNIHEKVRIFKHREQNVLVHSKTLKVFKASKSRGLFEVKKLGFLIEIETNGTNPAMIKELIDKKLVDYIAFDIKAPLKLEKYGKSTGIKNKKLFENVKKSIKLVMNSKVNYEFRITVVPTLHTKQDLIDIAKSLKGAKAFYLQQFKNDVPLLNPEFNKIKPYSKKELEGMCTAIKKYFKKCEVRA